MRVLILVFSLTGNNRLLARHLAERMRAERMGAERMEVEVEEVRERRLLPRIKLTIGLDLLFRRRPRVHPVRAAVEDVDMVLIAAPVWDARLAHPMASALRGLRGRLRACALVTLCGWAREGQADALLAEVAALTGIAPDPVVQIIVGDLVPPADRRTISIVSDRVVQPHELAVYDRQISALLARFAG